jgi:hypothetical protein
LIAGLYRSADGERLEVVASASAKPDDHLVVGTVTVGP